MLTALTRNSHRHLSFKLFIAPAFVNHDFPTDKLFHLNYAGACPRVVQRVQTGA